MARTNLAVLTLLLAAGPVLAAKPSGKPVDCVSAEAEAFTVLPMLAPAGRSDRGKAPYCLTNLRAESVTLRAGEGEPWSAPIEKGGFTLASGKLGNYHWLQAREETPDAIVTASTAHYFSNPGPAPTAMLLAPKAELEIVPQPLPREHWRYRAGEIWSFLVRLDGQPLAGAKVRLETSGGTQQIMTADGEGVVRVNFPADFRAARADHGGGHHGRGPENQFVLAVAHTDGNGFYRLASFNYKYSQAADTGRSLNAGLGFLALGVLIGLPLALGRGKGKKHG